MCLQWGSYRFPTIPDGTATNMLQFPSGSMLLLHWVRTDSQGIESHSHYLDTVERGISSHFYLGLNWFLIIPHGIATNLPQCSSEFPLILHWGRTDLKAIGSNCQWIQVVERGIPCVSNQIITGSQQFQMEQQQTCPYCHLGCSWFCIGGD